LEKFIYYLSINLANKGASAWSNSHCLWLSSTNFSKVPNFGKVYLLFIY